MGSLGKVKIFFFSLPFLGLHVWHMEVPRLESGLNYSCQPMAQLQQHQIPAVSATYTAACRNVESLTH